MYIACLDIGGTSIKYGLVQVVDKCDINSYKLLSFMSTPTNAKEGFDAIRSNVFSCIKTLLDSAPCSKIAISSAGTIDWDSGNVTYATDALPGFTGYEFCKDIRNSFNIPTVVINDATSAAIAEFYANNLQKNAIILTLGTGLGSALVSSDTLDANCVQDLHLGHICLHENGYKCLCGKCGCAEQYVSASAIKRDGCTQNIALVFTDPALAQAKKSFFDNLRLVLECCKKDYNPSSIVIGGGVVEIKDLWWNDFVASCKGDIATLLKPASLANKAGMLGVAFACENGIFKNQ